MFFTVAHLSVCMPIASNMKKISKQFVLTLNWINIKKKEKEKYFFLFFKYKKYKHNIGFYSANFKVQYVIALRKSYMCLLFWYIIASSVQYITLLGSPMNPLLGTYVYVCILTP